MVKANCRTPRGYGPAAANTINLISIQEGTILLAYIMGTFTEKVVQHVVGAAYMAKCTLSRPSWREWDHAWESLGSKREKDRVESSRWTGRV